jgi:hypothetical protein
LFTIFQKKQERILTQETIFQNQNKSLFQKTRTHFNRTNYNTSTPKPNHKQLFSKHNRTTLCLHLKHGGSGFSVQQNGAEDGAQVAVTSRADAVENTLRKTTACYKQKQTCKNNNPRSNHIKSKSNLIKIKNMSKSNQIKIKIRSHQNQIT